METDIIKIVVICIVAGLLWWANDSLNTVPKLKQVVSVLVIVVGVLCVLGPAIDLVKIAIHS